MVRPPSARREGRFWSVFWLWETVLTAPDPDRLTDLGKRLDELQTKQAAGSKGPPPSQSGIAARLVTELVAGLVVGGGIGWGIDRIFQTAPWGMVVFFTLGAVAGIHGVMRTAQKSTRITANDVEGK
jgi:ATP synthase protein I